MKKALIILLLISAVMGVNFVCADTESEILNGDIGFEEFPETEGQLESFYLSHCLQWWESNTSKENDFSNPLLLLLQALSGQLCRMEMMTSSRRRQ